jgi:hypothetical protein
MPDNEPDNLPFPQSDEGSLSCETQRQLILRDQPLLDQGCVHPKP